MLLRFLLISFEKLLTQALENYDKINGTIMFIDTYSFQQKNELIRNSPRSETSSVANKSR